MLISTSCLQSERASHQTSPCTNKDVHNCPTHKTTRTHTHKHTLTLMSAYISLSLYRKLAHSLYCMTRNARAHTERLRDTPPQTRTHTDRLRHTHAHTHTHKHTHKRTHTC